MIRLTLLLIVFIPFYGNAQKPDTTGYPKYITVDDPLGRPKNVKVAWAPEVLVVEGDSIYSIPNDYTLRMYLEKRKDRMSTIITDPDSIQSFARKRIKAIIIIEDKKNKGRH